ncbi:MAG: histidine kinase N-terminal domain-containing protein [Anaerolineae bacterium]|nr:histidine kinase N-terminal domain-containing protein [Anaerolineae bacterium]
MNQAIKRCKGLTEEDQALLARIEEGLGITADVSRADILIYGRARYDDAIVIAQAKPHSISPLYRSAIVGQMVSPAQQPIIFQGLNGVVAHEQRDRLMNGAPVVQEVYPVRNLAGRVIACLSIETNLIERERHRRRNPAFRRAVHWLQGMALRGELEGASELSPFGEWDGALFVDPQLRVRYVSGIGTNLYRRLGYMDDLRGRYLGTLRTGDDELVNEALRLRRCLETETRPKDRIWIKKAIPLRQEPGGLLSERLVLPNSWRRLWETWPTQMGLAGTLLLVHDDTDARQREQELKVKSVLIKEVHHRVKNNLQMVAGLLRMQARRSRSVEVRSQLEQAVERIMSVAIIHEFLSGEEGQLINIRDVCQRIIVLARQLALSAEKQINLEVEGPPTLYLPSQQAITCALVINECLQNSLEHGYQQRQAGTISIFLCEESDDVTIEIRDDGAGLPTDFELGHTDSMGLQIVNTLVQDNLKGTFTMRNEHGVSAVIRFRKSPLGSDETWKERA